MHSALTSVHIFWGLSECFTFTLVEAGVHPCITEFSSFAETLDPGSSLDWSTWCACLCLKRTKALEKKTLSSPEEDGNILKSRTFLPIHDNYCTVHCAALLLSLLFHQMVDKQLKQFLLLLLIFWVSASHDFCKTFFLQIPINHINMLCVLTCSVLLSALSVHSSTFLFQKTCSHTLQILVSNQSGFACSFGCVTRLPRGHLISRSFLPTSWIVIHLPFFF